MKIKSKIILIVIVVFILSTTCLVSYSISCIENKTDNNSFSKKELTKDKSNLLTNNNIFLPLADIDSLKRNVYVFPDKPNYKDNNIGYFIVIAVTIILAMITIIYTTLINIVYKHIKSIKDEAIEILKDTKDTKEQITEELQKETTKIITEAIENTNKRFEETENSIKLNSQRISKQFIQSMEIKQKLYSGIFLKLTESVLLDVSEKERLAIFDELFEKELNMYEVESYLTDLESKDPVLQEKAIWGIEALGPEQIGKPETIKILKDVADNEKYDSEIRMQAQRSISNLNKNT